MCLGHLARVVVSVALSQFVTTLQQVPAAFSVGKGHVDGLALRPGHLESLAQAVAGELLPCVVLYPFAEVLDIDVYVPVFDERLPGDRGTG